MSSLLVHLRQSRLAVLVAVCLAALTATTVYAGPQTGHTPPTTGDPDAIVPGKLAVGTGSVGAKALTVAGVIDFVGAGTVHNFFTQGAGNNMQIRANVDEANIVYDPTRSQWNMVLGSSSDMFSIKRSPAGVTYNEDALFWVHGSSGRVGIATFDTGNGAFTPFTPGSRLHVESSSEDAIWGINTSTSGSATGVYGETSATDGNGVFGYASGNGSAFGVVGVTESTGGVGIYGFAPGAGTAVWGDNVSALGWAGFFSGDLNVTGTLFKSAGAFRIDHPLDPSGMYLYHSFVESPDMKNLYDGVVTLDANGEALVELPEWFEALNMDFRYQLTPIGEAMPNLHIAQEIEGNRFKIAGGIAEVKVSWQVTGIRHDPYAEANRIQVEVQKPAEQQAVLQEAEPRRPGR